MCVASATVKTKKPPGYLPAAFSSFAQLCLCKNYFRAARTQGNGVTISTGLVEIFSPRMFSKTEP